MSTVQGNLRKKKTGELVAPNTTTAAVYDAAKQQALSATLRELPDRTALGFPPFATTEPYETGAIVFKDGALWKFTSAHAAGPWDGSEVEAYDIAKLVEDAAPETASLADNLRSWEERDALSLEDTFSEPVRTTAGDNSIVSSAGSKLVSLVARKDFYAASIRATGFNLLRNAVAVGSGYYILVPALEFGAFATAAKPNGILFTDAEGNNLRPTVRFKAYDAGVPASVNDGDACTFVDSGEYRFYTTPGPGYLIITGITPASTCAHVAWSRRYDEYVAIDDVDDAGSSVALASVIHAVHSYDRLLAIGTVADRIDFGTVAATWTRRVDRVKPTWTNTDNGDGTYTHEASISGMAPGGAAECGAINLIVDGATVSYTDESASATTEYVKYELATAATGSVAMSPDLSVIEDWGVEVLEGAVGSALVTIQYAQNYPDSIAALVTATTPAMQKVISAAFASLEARIASLEEDLRDADKRIHLTVDTLDARDVTLFGVPRILRGSIAGAPAAANVPSNWDNIANGVWGGFPLFLGQVYIDETSRKVYYATRVTGSVGDWTVLN